MSNLSETKEVVIRTLPTPNPYALKFVLNFPVKEQGKATFNTADEAQDLPMARDLFAIEGVRQIHFFQNTLTVTHNGELYNDDLESQVKAVVQTRFPVHDPKFGEVAKAKTKDYSALDPQLVAIEEILDRTIRPGLQSDGGDVEVLEFTNNELKIVYQGACGGCPSSMMGTLDAIQGILRNELNNPDLTVQPV